MTFNSYKLFKELEKNFDPYVLGIICGVITGRDLFLPNSVINLISLIRGCMQDYSIILEDDDWFLFIIGLLKSLEVYGFDRDYSVEWITLDEGEVLPEESKVVLIDKLNKKQLCITLFRKE